MRNHRWLIVAFLAFALHPTGLFAQARGTVTGTVTDAATQRPLAGVQVQVAGTQLGTITNQQGRYLILNVPAGEREVRAIMMGFAQVSRVVTVEAGETVTADFAVRETAIALEGLIVTASGETQRRREVGNTVGNINVADVEMAAVTSVSQLLTARSPGVTVQSSSGTTGGSQRIRIRGSNSVSLSNEPLMVIDGVRVNNSAESGAVAVGGQTISRLNDLNAEEIESIEILKGPAAAAMYGTAAANGVIQITTRRGRAGSARWNFYTEGGYMWDPTEYPANYGWRNAAGTSTQCTLFQVSTGACTRSGELLVWNPIEEVTPFRNASNIFDLDKAGTRTKFGGSVSGGTEAFTYFIAADRDEELGVYPNNELGRTSLRGNVTARLRDDFDVTLTTGWVQNLILSPQNDNNLNGQVAGGLLGTPIDNALRGYAGGTPEQLQQIDVQQAIRRFTGGLTGNYRPLPWLNIVSQSGLDALFRHDSQTLPSNTVFSSALNVLGYRGSFRAEIYNINTGLGATATHALTDEITSQTSAGFQYQRELFERTDAFGRQLLPGTRRLSGTSAQFAVDELFTDNRTIGAYIQQQFALRDRVFVTGALRGDDNSAFGSDFGLVIYPSLSASWVVAEEPWFPEQNFVSSLRLRGAVGSSGLRPTFRDAITFFEPVGATVNNTDTPAFTVGGIGDPSLKPEFTTEFEAGFDVGFLNERAGVELTYYNKRSKDALVFRRLAPSVGAARGVLGNLATGRFENIGRVSNTGWEVLLRAQPVNTRAFRWDVQGTLSTNNNELIELGEGIEPIVFGLGGASQRHTPGYPLGGYWDRTMESWNDANNDGIIQHTEIQLGELKFLGNPNPGHEFAISTTASLFDFARFNVLFDGKGDYVLNNSTRYFRCASAFVNCREAFDPTAPLEDQARAIAASGPAGSRGVYFEDASFVKLREVSLTLIAPQDWARRMRVEGLSLTFAGRNLKTWTDYTGFDPELNFAGGANHSVADFNTQPQLRYFTTRINLNF
jgi:TonB-dependent starch-binding outer membrane protein SusC